MLTHEVLVLISVIEIPNGMECTGIIYQPNVLHSNHRDDSPEQEWCAVHCARTTSVQSNRMHTCSRMNIKLAFISGVTLD
jgi:hypothetical protein